MKQDQIPPQDRDKNLMKWFTFPDMLPTGKFTGYQTRYDETQNRGAFIAGQNIKMNEAQNPTLRDGFEQLGTDLLDSYPVNRAWVFETRNGAQFELKAYNTGVYYWLWGVSSDWSLLKGGFTAALNFGYGNIGKSSEATTHTIFSNGTDGVYRFDGAYATISGTTVNTISIASGTWTALGFYTTGTRSVIINGTEYAYTGGEGTTTLTGVTPDPTGEANGSLAVQSPQAVGALSSYQGSVMMAHDGRLHMRLDTKKDISQYSKLDDPFDFTAGSSDGDGGAKEIEFGGPITAYGKLNKMALIFKNRIIKNLQFVQVGSRIDSPKWDTFVTADDKSTSLGAVNQKSTFSTPFGLVFVTPDKRMVLLSGVTANNEPQYFYLSDPVAQVFSKGVHDEGTGICVDNRIYYSFKQDQNSAANDIEIQGNMLRQTFDAQGRAIPILWDTVNIGVNCNDYTAIYNESLGKNEVHRHSSLNSNSYRIIDNKTDLTAPFTTTLRSWSEVFGEPTKQKVIDVCTIEIRMLTNSIVNAAILADQDGVRGRFPFTLRGTDTNNIITAPSSYNPFGASQYGSQRIGSNPQQIAMQRYFYWCELPANTQIFNVSLDLATDSENSDYELIRFAYRLVQYLPEAEYKFKKNSN